MGHFNFLLSFVLLLQNSSYLKALTTASESDSFNSTTITSNFTDTDLNTTNSDDLEVYSTRIFNDSENVETNLKSSSIIPLIVPPLEPVEENEKNDLRSTKDSKTLFSTSDPIEKTSIQNTDSSETEETHTTEENVKSTLPPEKLLHSNVESESQLNTKRIKRQVEAEEQVIPSAEEFSKDALESSDQEEIIPPNSLPQSDDNEETDDSSNSESSEETTDEPDPTEINFGNYFRSKRSAKASGEALEGAEFRYGIGFPYWYPRPFFGPRYLPWYSRRPWYPGYDYWRYPMFHGKK